MTPPIAALGVAQPAVSQTAGQMTLAQVWPLLTASQQKTVKARLRVKKVDVSDLPGPS